MIQKLLKYLAPYVFRVAISDNRILECTESTVTYQYTPSGTTKVLTKTVAGWKFARGFLQHVLPKGFRKVRHYGWMASNSRTTLERVKVARVAVSRLDLLAGQRRRSAAGAASESHPLQRLRRSAERDHDDRWQRTHPDETPTAQSRAHIC